MESFLNPTEVLKKIKIKDSMIAADFGAGSGGWVIPLAKKLASGKVYAIDILEEPLSALKSKAKFEKIYNIKTILADVEKKIENIRFASCDLILMTNLLFQCKNRKKVLEAGKRILKEDGRILVVDWKEATSFGPKEEIITPEEVKEIASSLNLKIEQEFDAGPYHYALLLARI